MQLWDTSIGSERYKSISKAYLRGTDLLLFVIDVSDPEALQKIQSQIDLTNDCICPSCGVPKKFLIGNKVDLPR